MFLALLMTIASMLTGTSLPVQCNVGAEPGVDAYVYLNTGPVHISHEWCSALHQPRETKKGAQAALIFAHELGHFKLNTWDEGRAECWGLNHVGLIARQLGWDPVKTRKDAKYWTFCGD